MKFANVSLVAFGLFVSLGARAEVASLTCFNDGRPADGSLSQLALERNAHGRYDVIQTSATLNRGGGDGTPHSRVVATNLKCVFDRADPRVASCRKSASEENEATNSGFVSNRVTQASVHDDGTSYEYTSIRMEAYSPILNERGERAFALEVQVAPARRFSECSVSQAAH